MSARNDGHRHCKGILRQKGSSTNKYQITYIGVPLAVLGVLPILWNTVRSLWIRHYLASLIPTKALKNVSLMVDPAAGVVLVVLDNLELRWRDLLRCASSRKSLPESLTPSKVKTINPQLIGCCWMGLYEANVPLVKIRGSSQRVVVDASLRFESRGVRCNRETVVLLALSLGVDPYRNRLDYIARSTDDSDVVALTDTEGRSIMSVSGASDRSLSVQLYSDLTFSKRRGLAWFCFMVVLEDGYLRYIPLVSVKETTPFDFITPPDAKTIRECTQQLDQGDMCLKLALTWACYTESVFYEGKGELLPVPQAVLKAREDALAELQALHSNDLEAHLRMIFPGDMHWVNKITNALKLAWLGAAPEISNGIRKGQIRGEVKSCKTFVDFYQFLPTNNILQELYDGIRPSARKQNRVLLLSNGSSAMATAGRIWLGLSIIQLWQREDWETELEVDGSEVAKPNFEILRAILNDDDGGLRHQDIYIG